MRLSVVIRAAVAGTVLSAQVASAQRPAGVTRRAAMPVAASSAAPAADGTGAFVLEALGGSAGSLIGIGAVVLASNCNVDDLACGLLTAGAMGIASTIGATIGTTVVAGQTGSRRSVVGGLTGAVVGIGVGLGVHALLNRNSDRNLDDAIVVVPIGVAQGVFAAVGSRVVGAARGMR